MSVDSPALLQATWQALSGLVLCGQPCWVLDMGADSPPGRTLRATAAVPSGSIYLKALCKRLPDAAPPQGCSGGAPRRGF